MATKYALSDFAASTEHPAKEVKEIFSQLTDYLTGLKIGDKLSIHGLGIFSKIKKKARKARNPKTGGMVDVPARVTIKFKLTNSMRDL